MATSRTKKSITNVAVSFISQFIIIVLGFVSRRVLIYSVGVQYLGINGLMTNILTIFSLAESGIGVAIGYALYKPLAENDTEKIKSLMQFFKRTYWALAALTAAVGLAFFPFLPVFLKDNTAPDANLIYFMFLFSSVVSYLWVYKTTLNGSDQNKYLYTIANTLTQILVLILKVWILYYFENYIIYLSIEIGTTIVKNVIFSLVVDRRYPYLKDKNVKKLDVETRSGLFRNIKALFLGKLGYIVSQCSDNLVMSSVVGITAVGLYSNYTTLISSISGFVTTFTSGVTASMGNLVASKDSSYAYKVYKKIDFINYWLYTVTAACLLCCIEPFVQVWLGADFVLSKYVLYLAVALYFFKGINSAVDVAKNAAGLYTPDKYVPLIEACLNLVISIIAAKHWGIAGVIFGTLLSFFLLSFWTKPYFVYHEVFQVPFSDYLGWMAKKIFVSLVAISSSYFLLFACALPNKLVEFFVKGIITFTLVNLALILAYRKTTEFDYIKQFLSLITSKMRVTVRRKS